MTKQLHSLQQRIGYTFKNPSLLRESLVHPSYVADHPNEKNHNQRLEFLGDAVLDLILSEALYTLYPGEREGPLSQSRAILAKGAFLSELAANLDLGKYLLMSQGERQHHGEKRPSTLEDAFEALVGAIYLDSDYATVRQVVLTWYGDLEASLEIYRNRTNPKGRLQELIQPEFGNAAISYEVSSTEGEAHDRFFEVQVLINKKQEGTGRGRTKKEAEEAAAAIALRKRSSANPAET